MTETFRHDLVGIPLSDALLTAWLADKLGMGADELKTVSLTISREPIKGADQVPVILGHKTQKLFVSITALVDHGRFSPGERRQALATAETKRRRSTAGATS